MQQNLRKVHNLILKYIHRQPFRFHSIRQTRSADVTKKKKKNRMESAKKLIKYVKPTILNNLFGRAC